MMEAICLCSCLKHSTSLRTLNLLFWIQPDKKKKLKKIKQDKNKNKKKKKKRLVGKR